MSLVRLALRLAALAVSVAAALALPATGLGKDGALAHLMRPLPLAAAPGAAVTIRWSVDVPDGRGGRRAFGASGMFVRLLSRTGGASTTGFADVTVGHDGRYAAFVPVPEGGIGGIRVGLMGTSCGPAGCRSAPWMFPLVNSPFRSLAAPLCDVSTVARVLREFVSAFDRGDVHAVNQLFSRERFAWFSSSGPGIRADEHATSRGTVAAYARQRRRQRDRLEVLSFRFNSYDPSRRLGHFQLHARRRADDFRGGHWFTIDGKGALDCGSSPVTIAALSLGGPGRAD